MESRINEAREFLNSLAEDPPKLQCEPGLLPALFKNLSDHGRMSAIDLAKLVERSQGLAARVLRVANSACYGLQSKVTSLTRAVQVLGLLELRSLALFFSVTGAIPQAQLPRGFPTVQLWEHQIRTALIGREIARLITDSGTDGKNAPDAEAIYTAALLHDLGKVVLAARRPEIWRAVTQLSVAENSAFAAAEDRYWGIDHGAIASILLKAWDLPDLLTQMINWHHHPQLAAEYRLEVHILAAANHLADSGLWGGNEFPAPVLSLLPQYAQLLNSNAAAIQNAMTGSLAGNLAAFAV